MAEETSSEDMVWKQVLGEPLLEAGLFKGHGVVKSMDEELQSHIWQMLDTLTVSAACWGLVLDSLPGIALGIILPR